MSSCHPTLLIGVHSNGQNAELSHKALVRAAKHSESIAGVIAEQLVRVHLDTGHAHYVLLLEQLCTETATVPSSAHKFLEALEATHQTYSEKCTDGSSDLECQQLPAGSKEDFYC